MYLKAKTKLFLKLRFIFSFRTLIYCYNIILRFELHKGLQYFKIVFKVGFQVPILQLRRFGMNVIMILGYLESFLGFHKWMILIEFLCMSTYRFEVSKLCCCLVVDVWITMLVGVVYKVDKYGDKTNSKVTFTITGWIHSKNYLAKAFICGLCQQRTEATTAKR